MYSHNCNHMVDSLRAAGLQVKVVTSNCRCFSTMQKFAVAPSELINENCSAITLPHAPRDPRRKHGWWKYVAVKVFRVDLVLAAVRGMLFYRRAREADVIHFDQVLEAFGCVPFFVLAALARGFGKRVMVTVHEIDPFQRDHPWLNRLYNSCTEVFVYSNNMRQELLSLGADPGKVKVIRYGAVIPELTMVERRQYIYFGGHHILRGKGYPELLEALAKLKSQEVRISLMIYTGYGCNGLAEAKQMAEEKQVAEMIAWRNFDFSGEVSAAYQQSKACIIPFTSGSARHPLTCALVNATPVIATRAIDIPEYLGDLGLYVSGSAESIAAAIGEVESGSRDLSALGTRLREKALAELDYGKIAQDISAEYFSRADHNSLVQIQPRAAV
jgi:glycosyltransferase involved in cell wall biosynthesis